MVKKVFPLLLIYVFMTTQCWAISGGPDYGRGTVSTIGTYSGTITGVTESDASTTGPSIPGDTLPPPNSTTTTNSNALGLFDLTVPTTGTASGAFLLFADGFVFGGTIDGSVDPDSDTLKGILQGTYSFNLTTFTSTGATNTTAVTAQALGMINARIAGTKTSSNVAARLAGSANLDVNFGTVNPTTLQPIIDRIITFTVSGFKQSATATSSASTIGTGSNSGGSTGSGGSGG